MIALIPARSGSSLKDKNIRPLKGYPLMAWSIVAADMAGMHSVVTTDSYEYEDIAHEYGATVLHRPSEICGDDADDYSYLKHFFDHLPVDRVAILRPTTPLRDPVILGLAKATNYILRSVHEMSESAYKSLVIRSHRLEGLDGASVDDVNAPRQSFPMTYHPNGYIDIVTREIIKTGRVFGNAVLPFVTAPTAEIDTEEDFDYIEWQVDKYGSPLYEYLGNIKKVRTAEFASRG